MTNEEIIREYRRIFLLDTDEIVDDSLKIDSTPGFQLYCSRCSDSDEFEQWLRTALTAKDTAHQKELEEAVEKARTERLTRELGNDFVRKCNKEGAKTERERIAEWLLMKGDMGKLTPFQETVNTYIANRLKELSGSQE